MIHYHGGPITPETAAWKAWKSRHAFVSYAHPQQIGLASEICQSFAVDNGAFTSWKQGVTPDWPGYYGWVDKWRNHPGFDFAVVPDVIGGSCEENDELASQWPFGHWQSLVVWHINEPIERLVQLCKNWSRVAIGSSGDFDVKFPSRYVIRCKTALAAVCSNGLPISKIHGLRCLNPKIFTNLPFSTADSTNCAINIGRDVNWKNGNYQPKSKDMRAAIMVERIEHENSASSLDWYSWETLTLMRNMVWDGHPIESVATAFQIDIRVMRDIVVP